MDISQDKFTLSNDRMQNILKSISKFKVEFINEREECRKLREINSKLEIEVKEARELEKSHRYHLLSSREMIGNLQETVSQLVYLKREVKKLKEEISSRDATMSALDKDKLNTLEKYEESLKELQKSHEKEIAELAVVNERKIREVQNECDTQIAQYSCTVEELKVKLREVEATHTQKMNVVVLEYEEKIQRSAAHIAQLQDQLTRQTTQTNANIDAYRRRLEELEEKLKQNQFKHFLAQNTYPSQYEAQVERPYSINKHPYSQNYSLDLDSALDNNKIQNTLSQNKTSKINTLQTVQVMYGKTPCHVYGKTPSVQRGADKKGQFNITKKRKLYNEKDFQNF